MHAVDRKKNTKMFFNKVQNEFQNLLQMMLYLVRQADVVFQRNYSIDIGSQWVCVRDETAQLLLMYLWTPTSNI